MAKFQNQTIRWYWVFAIVLWVAAYSDGVRAECYQEGIFSVKPISLNLSTMMDGYRKKNAFLDGFHVDPYQGRFGRIFHRGRNMGVGYDLEFGYFLFDNIELCTILSYINERGKLIGKVNHGSVNTFNPFNPVVSLDFSYKFSSRKDAGILIGGRYFWSLEDSKWLPFVTIMGGVMSQGSTKAEILNLISPPPALSAIPLGKFKLQGRKALGDVLLQAGADYRVNECIALTFVAGAEYTNRNKLHVTPIPGFSKPVSYKDHFNRWTFPIQLSLRITF